MANYIQKFQNQSAYDAAEHQYPNTSLVGTDIVFAMAAPVAFGGLTVKYNIVDPTAEVTLFNGGGGSSTSSSSSESSSESGGGGALPTTMIVDGVSETPINTWRFETAGEHIVQYEFENNIINVAFDNIHEITEIVIGDDITEIPTLSANGVFLSCLSLTTVTIGTGITSIGDMAFQSCSSLTSFTVKATTPPTLDNGALSNTSNNMVIYVPAASIETYKEAGVWSDYALHIQPIA